MIVLVCGGRYFDGDVDSTLDKLHSEQRITRLVIGGCSGADALAWKWATKNGLPDILVHYAQWHLYGKAAGPLRNAEMLRLDKPDLVVAFPGGSGTADMVRKAQAAGVRVLEVPHVVPVDTLVAPE